MGNRISAVIQEKILELLQQGLSQRKVAEALGVSRGTVQKVAKNGLVVKPNVKRKKYIPGIVPSIFEDTEIKRCSECGRMMKIGFEDNICFKCTTVTQLKKEELKEDD